jgi:hypothetical protein
MWEDNTKIDLKKRKLEGVCWIHLIQTDGHSEVIYLRVT